MVREARDVDVLVEFRAQKVVHESRLVLIPIVHGLILEDEVCAERKMSAGHARTYTREMEIRTIVPSPLHSEGSRDRCVDPRGLAEGCSEIEEWIGSGDVVFLLRCRRSGYFAFLPLLFFGSFAFDLFQLPEKLSSIVLIIIVLILVVLVFTIA